jgi:ribosome-associated protein
VAADYRGQDTQVLDLRGITPIVDFFVITTGSSNRQMLSLAEEVSRVMKEHGSRALGREGGHGSRWILHDYGDIVLHVFDSEARALYDLEHLWADAPRVDWQAAFGDQD